MTQEDSMSNDSIVIEFVIVFEYRGILENTKVTFKEGSTCFGQWSDTRYDTCIEEIILDDSNKTYGAEELDR